MATVSPAGSRVLGLYWGAVSVSCALLMPWAPEAAAWAPPCLFRSITGLPCPTCGATRAVVALSRLHLSAALAGNPLMAAAVILFLLGGLAAGAAALAGRPFKEPTAFGPRMRWAAAAVIGANWLWVLVRSS